MMGFLRRIRRVVAPPRPPPPAVVHLPAAPGPVRGTVVLSYLTDCFSDAAASHYHANRWECRAMARAFNDAGYNVTAIDWQDRDFRPGADCVAIVDLHANLDRLAALAPTGARKIHHATGAHWEFQNRAEQARNEALHVRRGIRLPLRRQVTPSRAIETAECATTTGNAFTIGTFAFAKKPMTRVPVSSTYTRASLDGKNFESVRRRFLWLGSHGLVHKGLDLVLEAFARTPELQLTVAGPVGSEPDFAAAYRRELSLPNVTVLDWVDTRSQLFHDLLNAHGAIVYPSCSEGGGGSAVTCLHGGLVPIVTREASVDVEDFGIELPTAEVDILIDAVRGFAGLPSAERAERSQAAWRFARRVHTRQNFEQTYRQFVSGLFQVELAGAHPISPSPA